MNLMGKRGASHQQVWSHANGAAYALPGFSHLSHSLQSEREMGRNVRQEAKINTGEKSSEVLPGGERKGVVLRFTCVLQLSDDGRKMIMPKMYWNALKSCQLWMSLLISFDLSALMLSEQPQICKTQSLWHWSIVMKGFHTPYNALSWKAFWFFLH